MNDELSYNTVQRWCKVLQTFVHNQKFRSGACRSGLYHNSYVVFMIWFPNFEVFKSCLKTYTLRLGRKTTLPYLTSQLHAVLHMLSALRDTAKLTDLELQLLLPLFTYQNPIFWGLSDMGRHSTSFIDQNVFLLIYLQFVVIRRQQNGLEKNG